MTIVLFAGALRGRPLAVPRDHRCLRRRLPVSGMGALITVRRAGIRPEFGQAGTRLLHPASPDLGLRPSGVTASNPAFRERSRSRLSIPVRPVDRVLARAASARRPMTQAPSGVAPSPLRDAISGFHAEILRDRGNYVIGEFVCRFQGELPIPIREAMAACVNYNSMHEFY